MESADKIKIDVDAPRREVPRELVIRRRRPGPTNDPKPEVVQQHFAADPGAAGTNRKARRAAKAFLRSQKGKKVPYG